MLSSFDPLRMQTGNSTPGISQAGNYNRPGARKKMSTLQVLEGDNVQTGNSTVISQAGNSNTQGTKRKMCTPQVPQWDNFAIKKKHKETTLVDELLCELENAINHNSKNLINVLQEIKEKPEEKYFSILLTNLQKIDPQDLDECFIKLLEEIENFKKII